MDPPAVETPDGSGTRDAFDEFVRRRSMHLLRLALLLTASNLASAQDLVQIALERAYRRRWLLFREGGSAEPYVRKMLVNAAIDARRVLHRRAEVPLEYARHERVDDRTAQLADRDLLLRALSSLPSKQRAVLVLRYWEDLSDGEIASTLNCRVTTVRSQASRALARLRQVTGLASAERTNYSNAGEQHE